MAPAESDVASLRDALAVMADCEDDLACFLALDTVTSDAAPGTPPDAKTRAAPPPRLAAPTKPLRRLLIRKAAALKLSPRAYATRWMEAQSLRKEWQAMVASQKEQLENAQHENAQLRNLITAERKGAHKITRLLQRALQMETPAPRVPRIVRFGFDHYRGPREAPELHLQRLAKVLATATRAFTDGVFTVKRSAFREVQFYDSQPDDNEVGIVFSMAWELPYAMDKVATALWRQTTRASPKKSVEWMDLYDDTSVMVSQFIATPTDASEPLIKHGQMAARRVPRDRQFDNNAVVIVATTQIRAFQDDQTKGEAHCDTWIRVERRGPSLSRVQWCRRVGIQPPFAEFATQQQRAEWIQSAISGPMRACEERKLDWTLQAVENALLDASRVQCVH